MTRLRTVVLPVRMWWLRTRGARRRGAIACLAATLATAGCATGSPAFERSTTPASPAPGTIAGTPASPGPALPATPPPATSPGGLPRPAHLVLVVFENQSYKAVVGNPRSPYLNQLLKRAAVFPAATAVTHPSQPNYLALFSGSTQGVADDHCPVRLGARPNLASQLFEAGFSFTGYSEDLPSPGYRGCSQGRYAAKHNPWADFDNVPASANQPYSAFPADFGQLPTVAFVVPNMCNDMHDCGIAAGDRWAATNLDRYLRWADEHDSVLIVTFDENDGSPGNRILTLVAGARVRPGTYPEPVSHYRVLRTIEAMYGLAPLGEAARTQPLTAIWR